MLKECGEKFNKLDKNVILRSLIYFDEVKPEGVVFLRGKEVSFDVVKKFLIQEVKKVSIS